MKKKTRSVQVPDFENDAPKDECHHASLYVTLRHDIAHRSGHTLAPPDIVAWSASLGDFWFAMTSLKAWYGNDLEGGQSR